MTADKTRRTFKDWYGENADDLNARRRERYATDKEHREHVRKVNREASARRRAESAAEKAEAQKEVKLAKGTGWRTEKVEVDGVFVTMFTIGALAQATGLSISTLRVWERRGFLPETPYRSSRGDRLYPLELVEKSRKAIRTARREVPQKKKRDRTCVVRQIEFGNGEVHEIRLYKISVLARAINRTVVGVALMESKGYLPETPFRGSAIGYRLYTLEMIEVVKKALEKRGSVMRQKADLRDFHDEVIDGWVELGVLDARLVE
jgi:hypothetical protein